METRTMNRSSFCWVALLAATLVGCGKPAHQLDTAPVTGRITLDGNPLPQGIVYVTPARGRMAKAMIQEDGTFELSTYGDGDGAQVGTHAGTVSALPLDESSLQDKELRVRVPKRYSRAATSGLTVEVKAGENNVVEWALTSKPSRE